MFLGCIRDPYLAPVMTSIPGPIVIVAYIFWVFRESRANPGCGSASGSPAFFPKCSELLPTPLDRLHDLSNSSFIDGLVIDLVL